MKIKIFTLSLLLLISNSICFGQRFKEKKASGSNVTDKIEELIIPLVKSNNYSGSVIIQKKGKNIFKKSYGLRNREKGIKNTAQTKFFLASVSAMFTATGIMKLVDEGKISLDDKLSKFLPGFKNGDKMTIHYLLTERSGIPRIGSQGKVNYSQLTESAQTIDELIGYLKDLDLVFEPGAKYQHTRSSYILLAKIIEKVSGKPFGEYLKQKIFTPLGMKNTGHYAYKTKYGDVPNLAKGYVQAGVTDLDLAQQIHWSSKTGHASIFSTAEDLNKFANAALNKKFLSADSWKKTLTSQHGDSVGYGWFISPQGKHKRFHMSGGSPGFSSFIAVYPDEELIIIMLSNINIHVPYFTVPSFASIIFNEPYKKLNLITPPDVDKKLVEKFLGSFQFGEDFYRRNGTVKITSKGTRLFSDGAPLIPIDEGTGKIRKFINRRYWSTLEFVNGDDGKVIELKFDSFSGKKIK